MKVKINRRGFVKAPTNITEQAADVLADFIDATGATAVLAQLRPAVYCGDDSAGAAGAYMLDITGNGALARHSLTVIYPPVQS